VELALNNLKSAKVNSLKDIYKLAPKKLAPLIRPSGFYKTKAQYLFNLTKFVIENYGGLEKMKKAEFEELRKKLLELKGIGPETADSILLYALDKPIFVIDEYTRRLAKKYKLPDKADYHFLQKIFEKSLKKDYRLYQDFHALIVINGKKHGNKN
jgi:endonuclease-3 related protein